MDPTSNTTRDRLLGGLALAAGALALRDVTELPGSLLETPGLCLATAWILSVLLEVVGPVVARAARVALRALRRVRGRAVVARLRRSPFPDAEEVSERRSRSGWGPLRSCRRCGTYRPAPVRVCPGCARAC